MNLSQMARNPNVKIFWPADDKGERSALALPYTIGLVQNGPNSENGKKLINFLLDKPAQSSVSARSWACRYAAMWRRMTLTLRRRKRRSTA